MILSSKSVLFISKVPLLTRLNSEFEFWNLTFSMPANSSDVPSIQFKFTLE